MRTIEPPAINRRENSIQSRLIHELTLKGCYVQKTVGQTRNGYPDVTCIFPNGCVWFIEVKAERGRLTPVEKHELQLIHQAKGNIMIVKGQTGMSTLFEEYSHIADYWHYGATVISGKELQWKSSLTK